jgi:hypothetical protein
MGIRWRATGATAAVAVMIGAAGCGIGSKQQQAATIVRARTNAIAKHSAIGSMTFKVTSEPLASSIDTTIPPQAREPRSRSITVPIRFDFSTNRADMELKPVPVIPPGIAAVPAAPPTTTAAAPAATAAAATPAAPTTTTTAPPALAAVEPGPTAVFHGDVAFVKRVNRLATERRGWARLDFGALPARELGPDATELAGYKRLYAIANTLSPQYALDLAVGPLAGSVKLAGQETLGATPTRHFHANVSLDKMNADLHLSEDQKATRRRVFALLGIYADVNKADFWVDGAGLLRRAQFTFDQRLISVHNTVLVTLDIADYGAPVKVAAPTADETVKVSGYGRFVRASIPTN